MEYCKYTLRAIELCKRHYIPFTRTFFADDTSGDAMRRRWNHPTYPLVFVNSKLLGGCDDLYEFIRRGC